MSGLHPVVDLEWMKEAYRLTRKDGAPGIDGVTADDYATNLDANLSDLLDRIKSGRYKAPPVPQDIYSEGGWLASAARHPDLRGQGGAESNRQWCWNGCVSGTFFPAHSASGPVARLIKHYSLCVRAS